MAGFDKEKDVLIAKIGKQVVAEGKNIFLRLRVYSYDGGEQKIAIERIAIQKDGTEKYMKVGRISVEEAAFLVEKLSKYVSKHKTNGVTKTKEVQGKTKAKVPPKKTKMKTKTKTKTKTKAASVGGW